MKGFKKLLTKNRGKIIGFIIPIISYAYILFPLGEVKSETKVLFRAILVILIWGGVSLGNDYDKEREN